MTITIAVLGWIAISAFNLWALVGDQTRTFGKVTRGDLAFCLFLAVLGPLGLLAAIAALCHGKFNRFWSKRVWP
jgi:hypothetical protein